MFKILNLFFICLFIFPIASFANSAGDILKADLSGPVVLTEGRENKYVLALTAAGGLPLTPETLMEVHKSKIHLLVIDDSMADYQHIHPLPGATPGQYTFSFIPQTAHSYTIWADITLIDGSHYYLKQFMTGKEPCATACIDTAPSLTGAAGGLKATLSFDKPILKQGEMAMGSVMIADAQGQPVKDLQPVMGAFAHIVGFYVEKPGVIHIHPAGEEPKDDSVRGGPELMFHLEPNAVGAIKLFVQVKRANKDIFIPFTWAISGL